MSEWARGAAKLRAIIDTFPIIPLGDLPSWDMGFEDGTERTDVMTNANAVSTDGTGKAIGDAGYEQVPSRPKA